MSRPAKGLTSGTITRLEAGTTDPSWSSITPLAAALDLQPSELVRMAENG
jgi:transcriptional regulator with XRE-family HTH domain